MDDLSMELGEVGDMTEEMDDGLDLAVEDEETDAEADEILDEILAGRRVERGGDVPDAPVTGEDAELDQLLRKAKKER